MKIKTNFTHHTCFHQDTQHHHHRQFKKNQKENTVGIILVFENRIFSYTELIHTCFCNVELSVSFIEVTHIFYLYLLFFSLIFHNKLLIINTGSTD